MHIFRLFGISVIIPLLGVGLCATSGKNNSTNNSSHILNHSRSKISRKVTTIEIGGNDVNSTATTPSSAIFPNSTTSGTAGTLGQNETLPTLLINPRILDTFLSSGTFSSSHSTNPLYINHGEARNGWGWGNPLSILGDLLNLTFIIKLLWKALTSYAIVALVQLLLTPFFKKFGWGGPYWETSINLGNEEHQHFPSIFKIGPSLNKLRISFGSSPQGNSKKDEDHDKKEEDHTHSHQHKGWGQPPLKGWPSNQPGHLGFNPQHQGPGWLSYDQYALTLPQVDKYSIKAAKKAQKYQKKAQKYAHKASKYAAKAQAAKLAIKPLYAPLPGHYINPGFAVPHGHQSYGWGRKRK